MYQEYVLCCYFFDTEAFEACFRFLQLDVMWYE